MTGKNGNIVIKNRYFKTKKETAKVVGKKLSNHFKYLEHRPKDGSETREDRFIFNAESDHIARKEAVSDLMEHRSHRVDYHHLILSPDPQEPIRDMHQWTRDILHDFQQQQGKEIHWYAVEHHNTTSHPHVHVVIAGAGVVKDQEHHQPVTIYKNDLAQLHQSAFEHSDHELYHLMNELHQRDIQEFQQEAHHEVPHTVDIDYSF